MEFGKSARRSTMTRSSSLGYVPMTGWGVKKSCAMLSTPSERSRPSISCGRSCTIIRPGSVDCLRTSFRTRPRPPPTSTRRACYARSLTSSGARAVIYFGRSCNIVSWARLLPMADETAIAEVKRSNCLGWLCNHSKKFASVSVAY